MGKTIVTILILANIFLGYFAEAYQGEASHCNSTVSQQLSHSSQDSQGADTQNSEHSDRECPSTHCHFGHCATLKQSDAVHINMSKSSTIAFNPNLCPSDYVLDLLRPPISA